MGYSKQDFEGTTSFLTGNELVLHDQSETAHPSLLALLKKHLEDELAKSAEIKDNKNIAGGYAGLDANGKIPYGLINTITTSLLGKGAVTREKLAAELIEELEGFVVKENGKGLSEVNYTKDRDEAVQKIAGILSDIYHLKQNSASSNALNKHVSDGTVHMTAAEREVFLKTAEGLVEECEKFAKAAAEEAERLANIVKQGNGENSVVLNDLKNNLAEGQYSVAIGDNATALTDHSTAMGYNVTAGQKGYYFSHLDTTNKRIKLSLIKPEPPIITTDFVADSTFIAPSWEVGDELSMIPKTTEELRTHLHFKATITNIENDIITYDGNFGVNSLYTDAWDGGNTVFVPSKPNVGEVIIGTMAMAFSQDSIASGENSLSLGYNNISAGAHSVTIGRNNKTGYAAVAAGSSNVASGVSSVALGEDGKASGNAAITLGNSNTASGKASVAGGIDSVSGNEGAVALGIGAEANGKGSFAVGYQSKAQAAYTQAEGYITQALGSMSHAEGNQTVAEATANYSHVEGNRNHTVGENSHAEGYKTYANGSSSHSEGNNTQAGGLGGHTEGISTTTSADGAHAEGYYTSAKSKNQHVQGKFNIPDAANKYAHIVGNGTADDSRSNAHTLDWEGNAWFKGDVYVGGENAESGERLVKFSEADDLDKRTKQLQYYGDANIEPSDESLFTFTLNNGGSSYSISLKKPSERDLATAEIVIPYEHDGLPVREIADDGFASAKSYFRALDRIIIPSSIRVIGISAFYNNPNITYAIEIPDSVRQIGDFAFDRCFIPSELEIPDGVKVIEAGTFMATTITSVVLPKALTDISDSAFDACVTLKDVYYKGSSSQWEQISIGDNNYYLLNEANIHFGYVEDGYYATAEEVKKTSAESANAITKTVRGLSSISVYDVSPARHKIKLQLMRYNLLNINTMLNDNLTAEASEGETYNLRTGTDSDTPSYLSEKIELNIPANRAIRMCMGGIAFVAGSNYTGEDNKASLIGIFTLSDGTEVKEKFIDGRSLTFDKDITHIQLYAYSFYAIPVTDEVSVSTYAPSGIYDTTPSMCRFTQLMICYDYDDVSYEYFPYDTAYGESMHIVVTDSNNEEITYTADAGGYAEIESIYPIMKIGVDVSALLECEYNQDINAVIAALESKIAELQGS